MPFPGHLGRDAELSELERVQLWNNLYLANLSLVLAQGSHLPPCFWLFQLLLGVLFQTHLCWWFMGLAPAGWTWCVCGRESCRPSLLSWDWTPPAVPKFSAFHFIFLLAREFHVSHTRLHQWSSLHLTRRNRAWGHFLLWAPIRLLFAFPFFCSLT